MIERYLRLATISQRLDMSRRTIQRLVEQGHFPAPIKIGAMARWRERDVEDYLARTLYAPEKTQRQPATGDDSRGKGPNRPRQATEPR